MEKPHSEQPGEIVEEMDVDDRHTISDSQKPEILIEEEDGIITESLSVQIDDVASSTRRGRRKDWVWKYFQSVTDQQGKKESRCKLCSKTLVPRCYVLKGHMINLHPDIDELYDNLNQLVEDVSTDARIPRTSANMGRRKEPTWKYFITADCGKKPETAVCKLCSQKISPKNTRLKNHLEKCHPGLLDNNGSDDVDLTEHFKSNFNASNNSKQFLLSQKSSLRNKSRDSFTKCLFCQGKINQLSRAHLVFPAWRQSCSESVCELFQLDNSLQTYFTAEKFCDSCLSSIFNIDFTLKALSNLNTSLAKSRKMLENLLRENYEKVTSTAGPKVSKALNSYDQAVKTVFQALNPSKDVVTTLQKPSIGSKVVANSTNQPVKLKRVSRYGREVSYIDLSEESDATDIVDDEFSERVSEADEPEIPDFVSDKKSVKHDSRIRNNVLKPRIPLRKRDFKIATKAKRLDCPASGCKFSFYKQRWLDTHIRSAHEGDKLPYHCDQCPLKFKNSTCYEYHYRRHIQKPKFPCKTCNKPFFEKWSLTKHLTSSPTCHTSTLTPNKCSYCSKLCSAADLEQHEALHKSKDEETLPFACVLCEKQFTNTLDLRNHVGLEHEASLPKCDKCAKAFNSKANLKRHMEHLHCDRNPTLQCKECSYIGVTKSDYGRHLQTHRTGREYQCEQCGNTYKSSGNLKIHMMLHNNEAPYRCRLCPKAFNQSCKLKAHEQIHVSTKTYVCDKCGKSFRTSKNIYQHKTYHCKDGPKLPYSRSSKRKERVRKSVIISRNPVDPASVTQALSSSKDSIRAQPSESQDQPLDPAPLNIHPETNSQFYPMETEDSEGHYTTIIQTSISEPMIQTMLGNWVQSQNTIIQLHSVENPNEFRTLDLSQASTFISTSPQQQLFQDNEETPLHCSSHENNIK